ncbi:MAG TPA: hypothetical protein VK843_06575 [Planctomycetota bacterium]|nr:hypothetical protein [Planctomycetota bacterium]
MVSSNRILALIAAAVALTANAFADSITTLIAGNGAASTGGVVMFDMQVTNPNGVQIQAMDFNVLGHHVAFNAKIFVTPGSYVGNENNAAAWSLVSQASSVAEYQDVPAYVDIPDFALAPGSYGIAIYCDNQRLVFTDGTGANQNYANADLTLHLGAATFGFFSSTILSPKVFNGTFYYNGGPPRPTTYCVGGPDLGSPAEITSTGTASATASSGFTVFSYLMSGIGHPVPGLLIYGFNGGANWPFVNGATLCVQPPVSRTSVVLIGSPSWAGHQLDMNAFASGALGGHPHPNLRVAGAIVSCQWWSRAGGLSQPPFDTELSDALQYTVGP